MLPRTIDTARALLDRLLPRGALILSSLSFGYFVMGIIRNRIFATTFGAGPELDAYNAAFRIPEIALDVLVAAGLTAPFVPIFSSLRRDDERAANAFGRTVLTVAVLVISLAAIAIFVAAPWLATQIGRGFDEPTRALYVTLVRINVLAQVLFAASICLGEILVAHRRFLFYALAPILYTSGIIVGTVLGAERFGIVATAWGAVGGAAAHLGIRLAGTLRTSFRVRPALGIGTPAFREFIRLMIPRMVSHPIEPAIFTYFTVLASTLAVGGVSAVNFALDYQVVPVSLIGVAFSLAVFPTLSAAYADRDATTFRSVLGRNVLTIGGAHDAGGHRAVRRLGDPRRGLPRRRRVRAGGGRADLGDRGGVRPVRPVRRAGLSAVARPVRHPRHDPPGRRIVRGLRDRPCRVHRPGTVPRIARGAAWLCGGRGGQGRAARAVPRPTGPRHRALSQPAVARDRRGDRDPQAVAIGIGCLRDASTAGSSP